MANYITSSKTNTNDAHTFQHTTYTHTLREAIKAKSHSSKRSDRSLLFSLSARFFFSVCQPPSPTFSSLNQVRQHEAHFFFSVKFYTFSPPPCLFYNGHQKLLFSHTTNLFCLTIPRLMWNTKKQLSAWVSPAKTCCSDRTTDIFTITFLQDCEAITGVEQIATASRQEAGYTLDIGSVDHRTGM